MHILMPFNFGRAEKQIEYIADKYDTKELNISAVHFLDYSSNSVESIIKKEANELFEDVVDNSGSDISVSVYVGEVDEQTPEKISEKIIQYANKKDVELVVMSRRHRNPLTRLIKKGNTDRVLESDFCTVDVVEDN